MDISNSKAMAKASRTSLAARNIDLSHSDCMEIIAQQLGFANWNTCKALLENRMTVSSTIFVQHGRQYEAALFYKTAFGAKFLKEYTHQDELIAIDIMLHGLAVSVVGSNPRREAEPWRGGPFFPKAPGSVSSVIRLDVKNAASVVAAATAAGATERDELQIDAEGHKVAVIFDPFGHVSAIRERDRANGRVAA